MSNAVVMSNKHPEIKNRFLNIKKRRGHKRATIAVARMLLTAIYHMISNGQFYDSSMIVLIIVSFKLYLKTGNCL